MDCVIIFNVDDYEPARYARSKLLRSVGFEVREVGTGQDALRLASIDPPTLVILDVNLPDMSGFEVCRQLKESSATAAVPVLHMSATYTGAAYKALGLESGADAYLAEPVEAPVLLATVNALLRMKRAEDALRATVAREQSARAAAEAANRSKEEFIAVLAHELRNPLAPIRMAMHTLRPQAALDPDLARATGIVERQVRHLARLLDDLLDASRLTREKLELRKTEVTLQTVVMEALEATRDLIEAREHTVDFSLSTEPLWLDADPTRLTQVATNLLNNAARYTPPAGRISVRGDREGGEVVLRVRDTGIGIPPEMLGRIFDLFTQGDCTRTRSQGGLGIGLALARTLAELHGGTLTATSDGAGRGSEFVVRLPAGEPPMAPKAPDTASGGAEGSRRILLVEDNEETREGLRIALELAGHKVEAVGNGIQGIEIARATSPDVVVVDIGLPELDGYEVARRIRAALGDRVLLIALSGYGQRDGQAIEAGFDAYLVKPVSYEELARRLGESK